jgi:lysophospholipase L1-like esterase
MRLASLFLSIALLLPGAQPVWVATWAASAAPQLADRAQMTSAKLVFDNQTVREIVHISLGGDAVRVRLSNAFGKDEVEIGAARVAIREKGSAIAAGSDRALTFSGRNGVRIPPNGIVVSDPVQVKAASGSDLAISLFLPKSATGGGVHYSAQQTSYIASGNRTSDASLDGAAPLTSWAYLAGVDVQASGKAATIVAFGDSITDGARSTVDTNRRWPDVLAGRLRGSKHGKQLAVVNAGIGGNRILHDATSNVRFGVNALARFDRDVLAQPGVRYLIILEGINDLGHAGSSAPESESVTAEDIIAGITQLAERAHEKGIKVFGATLTPFEGTPFKGYFTPEKETRRKAVNQWIRTTKALDGFVDFEKAVRDPAHPDRMLPAYDGGDHLHPGDAGYKAMGEAIDLKLFR